MKLAGNSTDISNLKLTVQNNCAISDARFSREYSLCIYLLRLREFYRWKNEIPFGDPINQQALGDWVSETEAHWDTIEESEYQPLPIGENRYDPFDTSNINNHLQSSGLIYSAGLGRLGQPHFVLARQVSKSVTSQHTCIECDEELARDTITLPAMAQNKTIYIRHESFRQLIWQMIDEWNLHKSPGPMARLVEHYGIYKNGRLTDTIGAASRELSNLLVHHETGEIAAGDILGPGFSEMTCAFHGKPGEMQIRAVRDLLADSLSTWPMIVSNDHQQSIPYVDFWLTSLNGYREKIFNLSTPDQSLFSQDDNTRLNALNNMIDTQQKRWQNTAMSLLDKYQSQGTHFDVDATIELSAGAPL